MLWQLCLKGMQCFVLKCSLSSLIAENYQYKTCIRSTATWTTRRPEDQELRENQKGFRSSRLGDWDRTLFVAIIYRLGERQWMDWMNGVTPLKWEVSLVARLPGYYPLWARFFRSFISTWGTDISVSLLWGAALIECLWGEKALVELLYLSCVGELWLGSSDLQWRSEFVVLPYP